MAAHAILAKCCKEMDGRGKEILLEKLQKRHTTKKDGGISRRQQKIVRNAGESMMISITGKQRGS